MRRFEGVLGSLKARPKQALLIVLICLALIGVAVYVVSVQVWGLFHWRWAKQAIDRVALDEAETHLAICVKLWPSSAETHFLLARTYRRQGKLNSARTHLDKADKLQWVRELIDLELLLTQAQTGAIRPVEQTLLARLKEGHAEERLILEALVKGYVQVNILGDAYHWASIWQERYPHDWQPYYWRGIALERGSMQNLSQEAAGDFAKAVELKPDLIDARLRLGEILARLGQYNDALAQLNLFLNKYPDHSVAVMASVRCLRSSRRNDEARALLDDWLSRNPGSGIAYMLRGLLELDRDRPEEALQWLLKPQAQALVNVELNHTLAQVYRRLGRIEESNQLEEKNKELEKDFKRLEELTKESFSDPKNVALRQEAGNIHLKHGNHEEAARWLFSALQDSPNEKSTHRALAELYTKTGDKARAAEHRRKAQE